MTIFRRAAALIAVAVMVTACGDDFPPPPTDLAVDYSIVEYDDISFAGRTRLQVYVVAPAAKTRDQLAHTAMKAAMDLYLDKLPQLAVATLTDGPGGPYIAVADYAPDEHGVNGKSPLVNVTWALEAAENPPTSMTMRPYPPAQ